MKVHGVCGAAAEKWIELNENGGVKYLLNENPKIEASCLWTI
jgi:hypothetical protein